MSLNLDSPPYAGSTSTSFPKQQILIYRDITAALCFSPKISSASRVLPAFRADACTAAKSSSRTSAQSDMTRCPTTVATRISLKPQEKCRPRKKTEQYTVSPGMPNQQWIFNPSTINLRSYSTSIIIIFIKIHSL
jgi:hypothetical protein